MTTVTAPLDEPVAGDGAPISDAPIVAGTRPSSSVIPVVFGIAMVVVIVAIVVLVLSGTAFADPMAGT